MSIAGGPLATVVVPVYDRVQELHECLTSVLDQDADFEYEVLVVLDGSPDATRRLVERHRQSAPNQVRVLSRSQTSGTATRGRNIGIINARGSIVLFQDSDDVMTYSRVRRSVEVLKDRTVGAVAGLARYFHDQTRDVGIPFGQVQEPINVTTSLLSRTNPFVTSTVAVRRELLLVHGGFRTSMEYREDHELWLRLCLAGVIFHPINEIFAHYRIHAGNNEVNFKDQDREWQARMNQLVRKPYLEDEWGIWE